MDFLDSILDSMETGNGNRIVSDNHDWGQLAVSAEQITQAASEAARVFDAREYGISQAEVARRLEAANTPEKRAEVEQDLRQRGRRRANISTKNGRIQAVYGSGKAAWHGLGTVFAEPLTWQEAYERACAFECEKQPYLVWNTTEKAVGEGNRTVKQMAEVISRYVPNEQALTIANQLGRHLRMSENVFSVVRTDTGEIVGDKVGSRYKILQNREAFSALNDVMGDFGAKIESAGTLGGGESIWCLVHLPQNTKLIGESETHLYLCLTNRHDGRGYGLGFPTSLRVECQNTARVAVGQAKNKFRIRHTGDIAEKVKEMRRYFGIGVNNFAKWGETCESMKEIPLTGAARDNYFKSVLDGILAVSDAQCQLGANALATAVAVTQAEIERKEAYYANQIDHYKNVLRDMVERAENERCHPHGTLLGAKHAVDEHADHYRPRRVVGSETAQQEKRFISTQTGPADEMKQLAFTQAVTLMR